MNKNKENYVPTLAESNIEHLRGINPDTVDWKNKDDAYWKSVLTPLQYEVTRKKGTERAFTGLYDKYYKAGTYFCSCCGLALYDAKAKFDSGTGWPSFFETINDKAIRLLPDKFLFFTRRIEVLCSRCGAHLGHVFDDGPAPTGKRYCMNSVSLRHSDHMPR